jgi:NDP-sugar pyrophosphorylase family protein
VIVPPVVILAGGLGTRISSISTTTPKALLQIAGKPFLEWKISELKRSGVEKIYLLTGYLSEKIEHYISLNKFDLEIEIIRDKPKNQGTARSLLNALDHIMEDQFVLTYADNLLPLQISKFTHVLSQSRCRMVVSTWRGQADNFNADVLNNFVYEYSKTSKPHFKFLDFGYTFISKEAISHFQSTDVQDLGEVFAELASKGMLEAHVTSDKYFEIGTPKTLLEAQTFLENLKGTF